MTQATHTPGPWVVLNRGYKSHVTDNDMNWNAEIVGRGHAVNARLIAAAPDLLAALEALHSCHRAFSGNDNWTMMDDEARALAEAAINKAKGA